MFQFFINAEGGLTAAGYAVTILAAILFTVAAIILAGKESTRKKLRKNSFCIYSICLILFIINILLNLLNYKYNLNSLVLCMILGIYMQALSLTALGSNFILFIDKILLKCKI